jgi:hypothetical protein
MIDLMKGGWIMNSRRSQLYLAHARCDDEPDEVRSGDDDYLAEMRPEDAAEYIASMLSDMRALAAKAQFALLSDLISVAEEEARFHVPS